LDDCVLVLSQHYGNSMRNLFFHSVLILVVTLLAAAAIYPPSKSLNLAKDLAGGTSLVYQVNVGATDSVDTMERVRDLLKRRLDPDGLMDIAIEIQSGNRIEITMPLPKADVIAAKAAFEVSLAQLGSAAITPDALDMAIRGQDRPQQISRLSGGDADRLKLLEDAAVKFDTSQRASKELSEKIGPLQKALDDAETNLKAARLIQPALPKEGIDSLQRDRDQAQLAVLGASDAAAEATSAFDAAQRAVLASSISTSEIRRAIQLSNERRRSTNEAGEKVTVESARDRAVKRLYDKYPGMTTKLEAVVAKWDTFRSSRKSLDDVEDLKRLMKASGELSFRIAPKPSEALDEARLRQELRERGPRNVKSTDYKWFRLNKLESWYKSNEDFAALTANPGGYFSPRGYVVDEFDGEYYMLGYDTPWRGTDKKRLTAAEGAWRLASSQPSSDEMGRPCIVFDMDTLGADKMGQLTGSNIGNSMGVLLDDEVITAPNLQDRIAGSGRITGSFSMAEINYIVRVLNAGSLAAKVSPEPISDNTIGPELGADNLKKGLAAGVVAFVVVSGFMIVYYFAGGLFAVIGLFLHGIIILAAMALNNAAFSLPGIAGIVLVFGMAVDANVLVYERIREELTNHGHDLKTAVRLGYQRALNSIVDGNVTNLIVCVVLMFFGTQEIKGFAITMTIGAMTTLFCQLYVTRVFFSICIDRFKWRKMSMLPIAVPAIHRFLSPRVDWMKHRWKFMGISIALSVLCLVSIGYRGKDVLDNEFLGGTKVTVSFKKGEPSTPIYMKRSEVEDRIKKYVGDRVATVAQREAGLKDITDDAKRAEAARVVTEDRQLAELAEAEIISVNPQSDGVTSDTFVVKTVVHNGELVQSAVATVFQDVLPTLPKLAFPGDRLLVENANDPRISEIPARAITSPRLAEVLDMPGFIETARPFVGGVALGPFRFEPLAADPAYPSVSSLNDRLAAAIRRPQFTESVTRQHKWVVLEGTPEAAKSVVLLASDPRFSFLVDEASWNVELKRPEWNLAVTALTSQGRGASVESFSPAIAASFAYSAVWSVLLSAFLVIVYIFVRFNSLRYSFAAIATTLHDCLVAVGFLAVAGVVCEIAPRFASTIGLLPFKIDLNVIAAVLTILGYSLNDTIVVMDRIREKRGKLPFATRQVINDSINETISRTVITGGTVFIATMVLYLVGGEAIRSFAFCFLVGVVIGTYSSIAVAAPIVWVRASDPTVGKTDPETESTVEALPA